jgi:hypothetical protein
VEPERRSSLRLHSLSSGWPCGGLVPRTAIENYANCPRTAPAGHVVVCTLT